MQYRGHCSAQEQQMQQVQQLVACQVYVVYPILTATDCRKPVTSSWPAGRLPAHFQTAVTAMPRGDGLGSK